MKRLCIACLASLALAGCGKQEPAARPPIAPVASTALDSAGAGRVDWQQAPLDGEAFQGRSADEWRQQLLNPDQDAAGRQEAAQALASLGQQGSYHLFQALADRNADVRLQAIQAIQPHHIKEEQEQQPAMVSQLMGMLKDPSAAIREQAAHRLAWFDQTTSSRLNAGPMAKQRLEALQATYHFDSNRQVQLAARNSIISLYDHMRGTLDCPPGNNLFIDPQ